jgi:hypothetical protein
VLGICRRFARIHELLTGRAAGINPFAGRFVAADEIQAHTHNQKARRWGAGILPSGLMRRGAFELSSLPAPIHAVLPSAGERAGQGAPLWRQLDTGMPKPPAIAPRLLVDVSLGLRGLAPFAALLRSMSNLAQTVRLNGHL